MVSEIIKSASIPLAIVVVGLLGWQAMRAGMDGVLFMSTVGVVGGLAGYRAKTAIEKLKSKTPPDG